MIISHKKFFLLVIAFIVIISVVFCVKKIHATPETSGTINIYPVISIDYNLDTVELQIAKPTGTFQIGEQISVTGGAAPGLEQPVTGTIASFPTEATILVYNVAGGTFDHGNTITGDVSGATTQITGTQTSEDFTVGENIHSWDDNLNATIISTNGSGNLEAKITDESDWSHDGVISFYTNDTTHKFSYSTGPIAQPVYDIGDAINIPIEKGAFSGQATITAIEGNILSLGDILGTFSDGDFGTDSTSRFSFVVNGDMILLGSSTPDTTIESASDGITDPFTNGDTTTSQEMTFIFSSTVPDSSFQCDLDGGIDPKWDPCASPQPYNLLDIGNHTFQVRAISGDKNTDDTPASFSWTINTESETQILDHFTISEIPAQTSGSAFDISITAKDSDENAVTSFSGTVDLATGYKSISPSTSDTFVNGAVSQKVTVFGAGSGDTAQFITATNTDGSETGNSNTFDLITPDTVTASQTQKINSGAYDCFGNKILSQVKSDKPCPGTTSATTTTIATPAKDLGEVPKTPQPSAVIDIPAIKATPTYQQLATLAISGGQAISTNLTSGIAGQDVANLQTVLKQFVPNTYDGYAVTGYFGLVTREAVKAFQEKYANEILAPWGLTKGTGYVGPYTRKKIESLLKQQGQ